MRLETEGNQAVQESGWESWVSAKVWPVHTLSSGQSHLGSR